MDPLDPNASLIIPNTIPKRSKRTITELRYYELTEAELNGLEQLIGSTSITLGFASVGLGVFVSCIGTLVTLDNTHDLAKWTAFLVFVLISGVGTLWFAVQFGLSKSQVSKLIGGIRNSTR